MRKILALCLAVLMMAALAAPVMAAENVALGAEVELIGYLEASEEGKEFLTDGEYNTDMAYNAGMWGGKHAAFVIRYNADRETIELANYKEPPYQEGYPYYSFITLKLENVSDLESIRVVMADPDFGIGDFLIQEWDILVSATGEPGSWKVVHEARQTKENEEWKYDESEDLMWPVWTYDADLTGATGVKYVALGLCLLCNHNDLGKGQYVDMLEIEVYGTAAGAGAATEDTTPVTEDTTPVTEDTTPVTEDTTPVTEDTTPVTENTNTETPDAPATFDFVIVPAIALAAAAAGAVVLKKKEN